MKKAREVVNIEKFKNERYFVARDIRGRILTKRKVKNSKLTLRSATDRFKEVKT